MENAHYHFLKVPPMINVLMSKDLLHCKYKTNLKLGNVTSFLDGVSLQSCRLYRIYALILIIHRRYAALKYFYLLEIITFYYE